MKRREILALPAIAIPAIALAIQAVPAPAAANSGGGEKKDAPISPYIRVPILTASVRQRNGKRGVLSVEVGLDVSDPKLRAFADASLPRLRAGYVQILQIYAAGLDAGAPPNPDFLGGELQRETDKLLGKPGAKLLFGSLLMN